MSSHPEKSDTGTSSPVILELIRGWKWFAYVPAEAQEWLAERASLKQIPKGKAVYYAGDAATHIYGVVSGVFRVFLATSKGDEITLEEVVAGGWFPHIVPAEPPVYIANCICQEDATVAAISQSVIAEFSQRWPSYYRGLYTEFTSRAAVIGGRIELLSLHNLNVRLAVYLLRMIRLRGKQEADGSVWLAAIDSQSEVGSRVGGTRQRVNSIIKAWARRGLIEPHKDGFRILDIKSLTAEAKKTGFDLEAYLAGWHGGWQGRR
ncbi:MAG: Crp/Fnr family transcriptional regulator [Pseudomonadota bacterium]